jgi:hypothetical protein
MIDLPKTFTATVIRDQLRERPGAATFWWNQWWWCDLISTHPALWSYIYIYIYYIHIHIHITLYMNVCIYIMYIYIYSVYIYVYCTHCMSHCRKYLLFFWVPVSRLVGYKLHQACWSPLDATSRSTPSFSLLKKTFWGWQWVYWPKEVSFGQHVETWPVFFLIHLPGPGRSLYSHPGIDRIWTKFQKPSLKWEYDWKKQLKTIFQDSKDIRFTVKILLWITK